MKKEYLMTFNIEDMFSGGSSYITVENGRVNTQAAEDEFYAILRKNEGAILKDAEEEKSYIIDHLTKEQEEVLKEAHMAQYIGTDDDSPDDYEDWLCYQIDLVELKSLLKI